MISLSEDAAAELKAVQREKGIEGFGVRIQIVGGGCEGFLYDLLFADGPDPDDQVFDSHGLRLFVEPKTLGALRGLTIGFQKTERGPGFVFDNPSAKDRCACGASFSI